MKDLRKVTFTFHEHPKGDFWDVETIDKDGNGSTYGMEETLYGAFLSLCEHNGAIKTRLSRLQDPDRDALAKAFKYSIKTIDSIAAHIRRSFYER